MKKGFTLIELLGVIVLLAVIALITYPLIDNVIKDSREKAYEQTIIGIVEAAKQYGANNFLGYSSTSQQLQLSTLVEEGFLQSEEIINPINNEKITGCVIYRWIDNQYEFEYKQECDAEEDSEDLYTSLDCFAYEPYYIYNDYSSANSCIESNSDWLTTEQATKLCNGMVITNYFCGGTYNDISAIYNANSENEFMQAINSLSYTKGTNMNPIIPSQIEGIDVVTIGYRAFSGIIWNNSTESYYRSTRRIINSLIIPNTVMAIDEEAFSLNQISSIEIVDNSNLLYINDYSIIFNPITSLKLQNLPNLEYIGYSAFLSTKSYIATIFGINSNVEIGCEAFYNMNSYGSSLQSGLNYERDCRG